MAKLTKTYVDKLVAPVSGYDLHWDDQDRGFGVRITAAGKRTYVVQGRVNGRSARLTIGSHDPWTCDNARKEARELLMAMDRGIDPRAKAKEDATAKISLRDVADAYLRDRPLKDSSKSEIERHVTTTFAGWLTKPIASITREAVTKRFNEIKLFGLHGDRPAPSQANQGFAILRALFNFAIREYRKSDGTPAIADNPTEVLYKKWVPLKPRTGRIPDTKVGIVWTALQHMREHAHNRDTLASIDLVMFLLLTGARIGEGAALTWDRVNLDEGWWHIPDPKNSNPVWLPLSAQAVALLKSRERIEGSSFVFTSWGKCGHIKDPRDTMRRISDHAGAKLTPHDLRRTFTTIGVACCGIDLHKVELLTNHVPKGVTARHYLETSHLHYLLPQVQQIADWIEIQAGLLDGASGGGEISKATT